MKSSIHLVMYVSLSLLGCATPYHSNSLLGGYTETQLAPDVFRVGFQGNGYTSPERAQDFALLRAAELAQQNGFRYFVVIDERSSTEVQSFTTPSQTQTSTYGSGTSHGNIYMNPFGATYSGTSYTYLSSRTTHTPGQTHTFYKPRTGLLIQGFHSKPENIYTFDAEYLQQSVKQRYRIK